MEDESSKSAALLQWYDSQKRFLPWRASNDPYFIWVSEIMLQQTQVQAVIPYFEEFIALFPTVDALALAPIERVLAAWSGLGYYRRARYLHAAAKKIVEIGGFPKNAEELQSLPGIGAYTAAAVASIAFGEVVPVLDGNVERLLSRQLASKEDPKKKLGREKLLATAEEFLNPHRPGDSNQALMELGAMVCKPRNPLCHSCPVDLSCKARLEGDPEKYPVAKKRRPIEQVALKMAVVLEEDRLLLFRRPEGSDVLAGMWELPNVVWTDSATTDVEKALAVRYGGVWQLEEENRVIKHSITYRAIKVYVHLAKFETAGTLMEGPEAAWVRASKISRYPVSSMVQKVLKSSLPGFKRAFMDRN